MNFPQNTAAVTGTGFIGAVHVEALHRLGIRVKGILGSSPGKSKITFEIAGSEGSLAWDSEHPNALWLGHRDKANELLIRDPSLLDPAIRTFASYPGGHNEGFPDTFKQLYRAIYQRLAEEDFSSPKLFARFEDGHQELLLCEAILRSHREEAWRLVGNKPA